MIQPGDGVKPLVKAIEKAKKSIEIVIFRFDRAEIERALVDAAERGVFVHALIAFTNRGGEKSLRKLESHFLARGITVARTAGDLVRYHGKMMIVDRRELHLLAFNFTHLDIDHSRSFGLITRNPKLVQEAVTLFESDCKRQTYSAGSKKFLVSPVNARKELADFLKGAKRELLIYDPNVGDKAMIRLLHEQKAAGLEVRIVGESHAAGIEVRKLGRMRLHTRTIIRDGSQAFLGSQSLRQLELDSRREIGVIFRDAKIVKTLGRYFEEDWKASEAVAAGIGEAVVPVEKTAKKLAKAVTKKLPVQPVVEEVVKAVSKKSNHDPAVIKQVVKKAIKSVVSDTLREATKETVEELAKQVAATPE